MKKLFVILLLISYQYCVADFWTIKSTMGITRRKPFCFAIGNKGYMGAGGGQDFWQYDPTTDSWTQKADFSGGARIFGVSFALLNKGYAGLGGFSTTLFNDFWEYDPTQNMWTQKANFGGIARAGSSGFSSDSLGYIGFGYSLNPITFYNDLWEYHPQNDTWIQKTSLPGIPRAKCSTFTINDKAYLVAGQTMSYMVAELWEYDFINDSWIQKTNLPGNGTSDAIGFSISGKGYIGTGEVQVSSCCSFTNELYQYNATLDIWTQKAIFPGQVRDEGGGFAIGNRGYIGFGGQNGAILFTDFREYTPDSTTNIQELNNAMVSIEIFPNPSSGSFSIVFPSQIGNGKIEIFSVCGKNVFSEQINNELKRGINLTNISTGIYLMKVVDGGKSYCKKLIVE